MGAKTTKQRAKYDWTRLKQEFLTSAYIEVAPYLRSKDIDPKSGNATRQTSNWGSEKVAMRREAEQEARREIEAQEQQVILAMKKGFLEIGAYLPMLIQQYLKDVSAGQDRPRGLRPHQAKPLWEMVRTEAGLTTRIVESQLKSEEESLTDEELEAMNRDFERVLTDARHARQRVSKRLT